MKTLRLAPLVGALLLLVGCRGTEQAAYEGPGPMNTAITLDLSGTSPNNTIVENAMALDELSMLVTALQQAGLADELSTGGPYTVFAPLNDAIERADIDMSNTEALENVLLYHVADGDYEAGELTNGMMLVMENGEEAGISLGAGEPTPRIGDADIIYTDIESSNGVLHVINLVLNPVPGTGIDIN